MSTINFLHEIRERELNKAIIEILTRLPSENQKTLLEIGAGTGRQAKILSSKGFSVKAIDLPNSAYKHLREFEVTEYDGDILPCSTASIDIIFSSNVLEHIKNIDAFLKETYRVGRKNGIIIHILPTPSWRYWSNATYYPWLLKKLFIHMKNFLGPKASLRAHTETYKNTNLFSILYPHRHGEQGNAFSEIYYFSEYWWTKKFTAHNFHIKKVLPNDIFYTNASLLGSLIPINIRKYLARLLGSSCYIYILEKK